jgi:hypothetical protein
MMQNWCNWTWTKTEGQMLTDLWHWQLQPCLPRCLLRAIRCYAVGFLPFRQAHSWPFGTLRTLQELCCFLPATKCSTSRIPKLERRAAGILQVPIMLSRNILWQTLIESTQIRWFSRWSGWGGWSGRAVALQRPRVSKLGLKGPSNYHSNEMAVEAARWGASGPSLTLLRRHSFSLIFKSAWIFFDWREISTDYRTAHPVHCKEKKRGQFSIHF